MSHDHYENPLISRYASKQMSQIWSARKKFETWRSLWIALAESEKELGLEITDEQIAQLKEHRTNIDFDRAAEIEKVRRHDVMSHVEAYGEVAPLAEPIIHNGATSCFVTDNTDLILLRESLNLVASRLAAVIVALGKFAEEKRDLACLGFTHLQPAQPTTIGKRACLWNYDLVLDLQDLEYRLGHLRARSTKGTTGTQASFLELFDGDHGKVSSLEKLVATKIGFDETWEVTGQTYPRKLDAQVLDVLSGISQSAHKIATDIRILSHRKEIEEPIEAKQIGSSAMAYKRNPMRSERICSLARFVISLQSSPANTLATQWMERTLDDSANRRLVLPQAFLAVDSVLSILLNVCSGLVVYDKVIRNNLMAELPFMATENIMMSAVKKGKSRQDLHERIRVLSREAGAVVKVEGKPNDLFDRIKNDPDFADVEPELFSPNPNDYVGRSSEQVTEFVENVVAPIREKYSTSQVQAEELRV